MIQLVIFDLDGTLLYTLEDLADAVNHTLAKHHLPTHELSQYKYFVGNGIQQLLLRSTPQTIHHTPVFDHITRDFLQYYSDHKYDTTRPYNDIPELLHALEEQNKMIAVASNKMHDATLPIIRNYFPHIFFNAIVGLNDRRQAKPHPQMINEILETCQVANEHTIYIGDSNVDMLTARNANITSVGALWGYRTKEELLNAGADCIAAQPLDVLEIITRL